MVCTTGSARNSRLYLFVFLVSTGRSAETRKKSGSDFRTISLERYSPFFRPAFSMPFLIWAKVRLASYIEPGPP